MIYTNNAECEIIFLRSSLFNRTGRNYFPYICRTIDDRTYKQILDKKGFQGMRSNRKRGYLVVELETAEINSRRIASAAALPF